MSLRNQTRENLVAQLSRRLFDRLRLARLAAARHASGHIGMVHMERHLQPQTKRLHKFAVGVRLLAA